MATGVGEEMVRSSGQAAAGSGVDSLLQGYAHARLASAILAPVAGGTLFPTISRVRRGSIHRSLLHLSSSQLDSPSL